MVQKHLKPTQHTYDSSIDFFCFGFGSCEIPYLGKRIVSSTSLPIDVTGLQRSSRTEHYNAGQCSTSHNLLLHSSFSMETRHPLFLSSSPSTTQHQLAQVANPKRRGLLLLLICTSSARGQMCRCTSHQGVDLLGLWLELTGW